LGIQVPRVPGFSEEMREAGQEPPASADQRFLCPRGNRLRADCQEWTLSEFQTEVRELVSTPKKPRRQRQREREIHGK
jgi:hypothetical protein